MISKVYEKIKQFIIENYLILLFYLVFITVMTYQLPYYILTGGGTIDTTNRINIMNEYSSEGSFNLAYVSQLYATIPTYLLSKFIPDWTLENISDYKIQTEETQEEILIRDRLYLEEANAAAIFNAYQKASKTIEIKNEKLSIIYIEDRSKTDLKIGDQIIAVDSKKITNLDDLQSIVKTKNIGDKVTFKVKRDNKIITCTSSIIELDNTKMLGIALIKIYEYDLEPELELKFNKHESGPSGGLTLALTIYNKLIKEDITHGKKIVGTGTIDLSGNIGSIGGVTYKLDGAVKNKADIFIVPNGENYEDVVKRKKEKGYNIEIIGVDSFTDAIEKLEKLENI